ncbi:MAG TPA: hypothetical protein VFB63_14365 [Bryobacteraceae bacterium]|nr:hypothetical protein [Bryobacteraceae bacterium]
MHISLTETELAHLMKAVRGRGGWQALLRKLQAQVSGVTLTLTANDATRIARYRDKYGDGGWQKRLEFLKRVDLKSAA